MLSPLAYIAVVGIFLYYLGLVLFVTRLAIRSRRLRGFKEVSPAETLVLFSGLDRHQSKGGRHVPA